MRIGWLFDEPLKSKGYRGGAELSDDALRASAPEGVEIVEMLVRQYEPEFVDWREVDAYIIGQCTGFPPGIIDHMLRDKPFLKINSDAWSDGHAVLRRYILKHARMVTFNSPLHLHNFKHTVQAPIRIQPKAWVDPAPFVLERRVDRQGAVCLTRMHHTKGLHNVAAWAREQGVTVDVYGGPEPPTKAIEGGLLYHGPVHPDDVPGLLTRYESFVFLPDAPESYSRTTVEAWLAGCKLVVNENIGALHWIRNAPEVITGPIRENMWDAMLDALNDIPDVSVILPVYNCADTAVQAARSALDQKNVRLEVLAIDCGSPDNAGDKLLEEITDPRLRVIRPGTMKLGEGNNAAIAQARGRYLQYLEGDDYLEPGALAAMAQALDSYPAVGFVYGCVQYHGLREDRFVPQAFKREDFWRHNASLYPIMWRRGLDAKWHDFSAGIGIGDRDFILQLVEQTDGLALPGVLVLHYNFQRSGAWHRMQGYYQQLEAELRERHPQLV